MKSFYNYFFILLKVLSTVPTGLVRNMSLVHSRDKGQGTSGAMVAPRDNESSRMKSSKHRIKSFSFLTHTF